jgi:hypothetical protein
MQDGRDEGKRRHQDEIGDHASQERQVALSFLHAEQ